MFGLGFRLWNGMEGRRRFRRRPGGGGRNGSFTNFAEKDGPGLGFRGLDFGQVSATEYRPEGLDFGPNEFVYHVRFFYMLPMLTD
jgi:hypothetical protein